MEFKISDLTTDQINLLNQYNKDDLINILNNLNFMKEKRNNYHRLYYNKLKDDETKFNKIKNIRKQYYSTIKNDDEKCKNYLNKMKVYNKNYLDRKKLSPDYKKEHDGKKKKLNFIEVDDDFYIININKFINNFEDLELINKKLKQIFFNKKDVEEIFLTNDELNEENIKKFIVSKYNNIVKIKIKETI
jgi:hypothetical protein